MAAGRAPIKKPLATVELNLLQARCQKIISWTTLGFHVKIISNKSWHWSGPYKHFLSKTFPFLKQIFIKAFANSFCVECEFFLAVCNMYLATEFVARLSSISVRFTTLPVLANRRHLILHKIYENYYLWERCDKFVNWIIPRTNYCIAGVP